MVVFLLEIASVDAGIQQITISAYEDVLGCLSLLNHAFNRRYDVLELINSVIDDDSETSSRILS